MLLLRRILIWQVHGNVSRYGDIIKTGRMERRKGFAFLYKFYRRDEAFRTVSSLLHVKMR